MEKITKNRQFDLYCDFLLNENKKYNLTSITDRKEVYIKHFYDSLQMENMIDLNKPLILCDIGSGAGFPGIPLKIMYPKLKLILVEAQKKKCVFLKKLTEMLDLPDVSIVNKRAEELASLKESCDIATARAVAENSVLLELAVPLLKVKGIFFSYKGRCPDEKNIDVALNEIGAHIEKTYSYRLPDGMGQRKIYGFMKDKKTKDIYPRKYAAIRKMPLGDVKWGK